MFYGYIGNERGFSDVITGLLHGRTGTLELFTGRHFLYLGVREGLIAEFWCDMDASNKKKVNNHNLLTYCLAEMLSRPEGFFAIYEEEPSGRGLTLDPPIGGDELLIQATIVRKELDEIVEKIISPYAIFRATVPEPRATAYEGKNLVESVSLSGESIVSVLRDIKELLTEGKLDIYEFRESDWQSLSEVEYVMENVPLRSVNVIAILESLKGNSFSGIARISATTYTINLFYEKGEMFAVYPVDCDIFEYLLSPDRGAELSLISLDATVTRFIALRYLSKPSINTVSGDLIELSKLVLGLSKSKKDALLFVSERLGDRYIIFKDGKLVANLLESTDGIKPSDTLNFTKPNFISLYLYSEIDNLAPIVYLFMVNEILSVFMKHSPTKMSSLVLREAAKHPFIAFSEGRFVLTKNPDEEEQKKLADLLSFMLDLGAQEIGEKKQEEELEFQLRPFKDIFRILNIDRFLKEKSKESHA